MGHAAKGSEHTTFELLDRWAVCWWEWLRALVEPNASERVPSASR